MSDTLNDDDSDSYIDTEEESPNNKKKLNYDEANDMIKENIKKKFENNEIQIITENDNIEEDSDMELSYDEYVFSDE